MTVIPGQITLTFCYLAEGKGAVYAKALRGPCLDNSACKLNDPAIEVWVTEECLDMVLQICTASLKRHGWWAQLPCHAVAGGLLLLA